MKKLKRMFLVLFSVFFVFCSTIFTSCGSISTFSYENEDKYSIGSKAAITDSVNDFDVSWIDGSVTVEYYDYGEAIIIEENATRNLQEEEIMRYWLDGTTLRIQYAKSKNRMKNVSKNLTVKLPQAYLQENFNSWEIETVSASVTASNITANSFDVETVSGKISLKEMSITQDVELKSVSGAIISAFTNTTLNELSAENISGNINISAKKINNFEADIVSGHLSYTFETTNFLEIDCVSGNIYLNFPTMDTVALEFETTNGCLYINDDRIKTNNDYYKIGNGANEFDIQTSNGNLYININEINN